MMYLLVERWGFTSFVMENLANALSMELGILYNFVLSRHWTWKDAARKQGYELFKQLTSFHAVIGTTAVFRLILYPLLQLAGVHYLLNTLIGIGCAASINYFLYDKWIFKRKAKYEYEQ
jgi:dolichol-phosphate mannosyltransferase